MALQALSGGRAQCRDKYVSKVADAKSSNTPDLTCLPGSILGFFEGTWSGRTVHAHAREDAREGGFLMRQGLTALRGLLAPASAVGEY